MAQDNTIALQVQQPDMMKKLGSLIDMGKSQLELQKARDLYSSDVAKSQAESRGAVADSNVAVDTQGARTNQSVQASNQADTETESKQYSLTSAEAQKARDIAQSLTQDPDFVKGNGPNMINKLGKARQAMIDSGIRPTIAETTAAHMIALASTKPKNVHQALLNSITSGLSSGQQASVINPNGISTDDGQVTSTVNTNQLAGAIGTVIPGTKMQKLLPPTTPVYDPDKNSPGYLGAVKNNPNYPSSGENNNETSPVENNNETSPVANKSNPTGEFTKNSKNIIDQIKALKNPEDRKGAMQAFQDQFESKQQGQQYQQTIAQAPQQAKIQSGPSTGVTDNMGASNKVMNDHYSGLALEAANAEKLEGIAKNIQDFAPKAITGTESERLSFFNGILAQFKIGKADDLKTASDLLEKQIAMLNVNSSNAGTNFKSAINQMSQPHVTMTSDAISDAAAQFIGQKRMDKDLFKSFTNDKLSSDHSGNSRDYVQKMTRINDLSDARIWQYESLGANERTKFFAKMKPDDAKSFIAKTKVLENEGFFK